MGQDDNVVYLNNPSAADRLAPQEIYARLRLRVVARLSAALGEMLDKADDALFERAEKADSELQIEFFAAMRLVRLGRRELEEGFRSALEAAFDSLRSGIGETGAASIAGDDEVDLSLVDNEMLEETIAVDGMIAKGRTRNALVLSHLEAALAKAFPGTPVHERNSPFDPAQITHAFVASASRLAVELNPRLIIYKLFDKHVLGALPAVYEEADRVFVQAGLRTGGSKARPPRPQPLQQVMAQATSRLASPEQAATLLEVLSNLLSGEPTDADASWPMAGGATIVVGPVVSLTDLVAALSHLQRDADLAGEQTVKPLLDQVLKSRHRERRSLGPLEDAAIDIVGMLFDAILADPQLAASIKALIARLQIPVLKIALLDSSFFSSKHHPARRLINEMAQAALGWVEPAQVERDPLYRQIDSTVQRVLSDFDDKVELFSDLLDDFLIFLEEERERARLVEERTRQAAEGKAKVDNAKLRVDEEIRRRTAGLPIPEVVRSLLSGAWAKVLFLSYLKEGGDGAEWQRQLGVVDRLVHSVQPKNSADERRELLTEIPGLLHDLREGLNAILYNPFEMTKLFKELESEHIRCLAASERQHAPAAVPVEQPAARPAAPAVSDDLVDYVARLDEVATGTWFEFAQPSGVRIRAKLSARLGDTGRLIFVNRSGFKCADRDLQELARDLRDGKAVVLDDNLLFDKALEAVVLNLRSMGATG